MTDPQPQDRSDPTTFDEVMICVSCAAPNATTAEFCAQCGAPIGMFVTTDPLKHIYAQGWAYRQAVSGRRGPWVVLGMWLIFGPVVLFMSCEMFQVPRSLVGPRSSLADVLEQFKK